ncbi:zinc finger and SCAN domain-containing protein 29-like isoform X2 [Heteronotia binoei]|uniref:zinc finger and SCAN domain-containing protein 29-like isoform X2 n=1 Tax=Heteronotia binoei TaxID=13085 RepID=UPI00292F12EE|nr:zinc finger and SCAN domain-containing protein 29-like isoform X2 [Heteronotia binoei]
MKERKSAGLEREEEPGGGAGKAIRIIPPEDTAERFGWCEGGEERLWKVQSQDFLGRMDSPHTGWGKERSPWDDAKAFLVSFEQVAKACQWSRKEWVARLMPALSGEAQQAFGALEARDREDYGKVKAAILRWEANRMETLRQHFRQFRSQEVEDPRRIYSQLQELCRQWLRPERHSKEQILELLILEQFLAILPPELQSWIRAGCPENCTQAVALVDVFLMNHRGAETWKWQGPLREVGSLNAEEESLDLTQRKVYKEARQNSEGEIHLLGRGTKRPGHFPPSLPPEGQETAEAGKTKWMNTRETDVVKQSPMELGQRTMFWQVLQEDGGNVDTLEGFLVPKCGLASHLEKEEEMLVQFLEERERLPGQDPGDMKRIKKEDSEEEESGPEETWELSTEATQVGIPGTSEIHKQRCGRKGIKLQAEEAQYGRRESEETHRTVLHLAQRSTLKTAEIQEQACKSKRQYTPAKITVPTSPKGSPNMGEDTAVDRHGTMPAGENFHKCLVRGGDFHPSLPKHQRIPIGEKHYEFSHGRRSFLQREHLMRHQRRHARKKTYECPDCGKSLRSSGSFKSHQRIHTGERPYGCSYCAKSFNQSIHLERHQKVHTGEKPYECPECGRSFSRKDTLIKHQRTHTGHQQVFDCGS